VKTTTARDGSASYRGVLAAAGETAVILRLDDGREASIPYAAVARARIVPTCDRLGGQRE
jgi:ribosome maturation factor RimP